MDKNTIDTLKEFLPDYVIDEICNVNGCDFGEKEEKRDVKKNEKQEVKFDVNQLTLEIIEKIKKLPNKEKINKNNYNDFFELIDEILYLKSELDKNNKKYDIVNWDYFLEIQDIFNNFKRSDLIKKLETSINKIIKKSEINENNYNDFAELIDDINYIIEELEDAEFDINQIKSGDKFIEIQNIFNKYKKNEEIKEKVNEIINLINKLPNKKDINESNFNDFTGLIDEINSIKQKLDNILYDINKIKNWSSFIEIQDIFNKIKNTKKDFFLNKTENISKTTYNSIFDFLDPQNNIFESKKLPTKTTTKEIRYGIINEEIFGQLGKLPYFVFPVSISQISKLQELLKDIENIFKGIDSKNFIPSFMQSGNDNENIFGIDEKINLLTILTINFLNNNGKQLVSENIIYHNLKLEKITPELLKNPNFYKNFLVKDTSNIDTFIQSIDNKKTRFLKYYLIELSKNISDNKEALSKICFLLNNYLKEVKAEKTNINIFQYKDLRNIFALIKEIIEGDIQLKKVLLEKINDLYEIWLFQKMIISFNSKDGKLFDDLKNRIDEKIYNTIHIDELNKYLGDKNKITWNDGIIEQKEIYLNEKIIYLKNLEKIKKKLIEIDNEQIKENILNGTINLSLDKKSNTIDEIREYLNINNLNNDDYKKYNGIIFSKKENFIKIKGLNKKNIIIGKGFIKEDNPDFEDLSTIELDNLSNEKYNISISLGGHNKHLKNPTDKDDMLTKSFEVLISSKLDHLEDIIRSTSVTPDFIIKIKENNEIIGSIFLDAKFSKYPFFIDENMDYAPVLKYYHELGKNFSTTDIGNNFPYKVIILFPGDKEAKELQKLNDYFQRQSNIVAVPMMVGDENILDTNLKYLEKYILEFIKEIEYKKKTN